MTYKIIDLTKHNFEYKLVRYGMSDDIRDAQTIIIDYRKYTRYWYKFASFAITRSNLNNINIKDFK